MAKIIKGEGSGIHPAVGNERREGSALHRRPELAQREGSSIHRIPAPQKREASAGTVRPKKTISKGASASKNAAQAIVARAKREDVELQAVVDREIEAAVADAKVQGHAAGLADSEGLKEKISQLEAELLREVEPEALRVTHKIARRLYAAELAQYPETIVAIVRQALLSSRQQREVFVRAHPDHVDVLREHKAEIVDVLARAKDVDVREDPELTPGGCVIETEVGSVDARVETLFEVLERYLTSGRM